MSEFASILAKTGLQQQLPDAQTSLKSSGGDNKQSFQQVLEKTEAQPSSETQNVSGAARPNGVGATDSVSGARLEQMRVDLMNNVNNIGARNGKQALGQDLLPEMFIEKSRLGLLKEAMSGVNKTPQGTPLMNRFTQVEGEYNQIESIMKSNKELTSGELLGLQARLYQVGQHIEVMSKVIDQMTGGIKTILNTNI